MGVEERVRKQTEQRKVGLGLAGVRDTWGKVFHAKPLGSQRKWKSRMKAEPCFRRWLWQCLKWDCARKALKSEEELFQSLERSNKQQQKGNEDGKDTRAIAEGPVETWSQILESTTLFFHHRRK